MSSFKGGTLDVVCHSADKLAKTERFSKNDPYAKIIIDGKAKSLKKTPIHKNGGSQAKWDETLGTWELNGTEKTITLTVMTDKLGRDAVIGSHEFDLSKFVTLKGLQDIELKKKNEITGCLHVTVRFTPLTAAPIDKNADKPVDMSIRGQPAGTTRTNTNSTVKPPPPTNNRSIKPPSSLLSVLVVSASNLKHVEGMIGGKNDPYVTVEIVGSTRNKTSCKNEAGDAAEWNETLGPWELQGNEDEIIVTIVDHNKLMKHKRIGETKYELSEVINANGKALKKDIYEKGDVTGNITCVFLFGDQSKARGNNNNSSSSEKKNNQQQQQPPPSFDANNQLPPPPSEGYVGHLSIRMINACKLVDTEGRFGGKNDNFARITIDNQKVSNSDTLVIRDGGENADWNEDLGPWKLQGDEKSVTITVINHNRLKNAIIGSYTLSIHELIQAAGGGNGSGGITRTIYNDKNAVTGQITFSSMFQKHVAEEKQPLSSPPLSSLPSNNCNNNNNQVIKSGLLSLTVIKAWDLKAVDGGMFGRGGKNDPYVAIFIDGNSKLSNNTTNTIKNAGDQAEWNELLGPWDMTGNERDISINVIDYNMTKNKRIGETSITMKYINAMNQKDVDLKIFEKDQHTGFIRLHIDYTPSSEKKNNQQQQPPPPLFDANNQLPPPPSEGYVGHLSIRMINACKLVDTEGRFGGKNDNFARITIDNQKVSNSDTRVIRDGGENADWNEDLGPWKLQGDEKSVTITVINHNRLKNAIIGSYTLSIHELIQAAGGGNGSDGITRTIYNDKNAVTGQITFSSMFQKHVAEEKQKLSLLSDVRINRNVKTKGSLIIQVISASKLKAVDGMLGGENDPYVRININNVHVDKNKTSPIDEGGANVVWNESLGPWILQGNEQEAYIEVIDKNLTCDKVIGTATVSLNALIQSNGVQKDVIIKDKDNIITGYLRLQSQFKQFIETKSSQQYKTAVYDGQLRLHIINARELTNVEGRFGGKNDPFVRVLIDDNKKLLNNKTQVINEGGSDVTWNETLGPWTITKSMSKLVIEVFDRNKVLGNKKIGEIQLKMNEVLTKLRNDEFSLKLKSHDNDDCGELTFRVIYDEPNKVNVPPPTSTNITKLQLSKTRNVIGEVYFNIKDCELQLASDHTTISIMVDNDEKHSKTCILQGGNVGPFLIQSTDQVISIRLMEHGHVYGVFQARVGELLSQNGHNWYDIHGKTTADILGRVLVNAVNTGSVGDYNEKAKHELTLTASSIKLVENFGLSKCIFETSIDGEVIRSLSFGSITNNDVNLGKWAILDASNSEINFKLIVIQNDRAKLIGEFDIVVKDLLNKVPFQVIIRRGAQMVAVFDCHAKLSSSSSLSSSSLEGSLMYVAVTEVRWKKPSKRYKDPLAIVNCDNIPAKEKQTKPHMKNGALPRWNQELGPWYLDGRERNVFINICNFSKNGQHEILAVAQVCMDDMLKLKQKTRVPLWYENREVGYAFVQCRIQEKSKISKKIRHQNKNGGAKRVANEILTGTIDRSRDPFEIYDRLNRMENRLEEIDTPVSMKYGLNIETNPRVTASNPLIISPPTSPTHPNRLDLSWKKRRSLNGALPSSAYGNTIQTVPTKYHHVNNQQQQSSSSMKVSVDGQSYRDYVSNSRNNSPSSSLKYPTRAQHNVQQARVSSATQERLAKLEEEVRMSRDNERVGRLEQTVQDIATRALSPASPQYYNGVVSPPPAAASAYYYPQQSPQYYSGVVSPPPLSPLSPPQHYYHHQQQPGLYNYSISPPPTTTTTPWLAGASSLSNHELNYDSDDDDDGGDDVYDNQRYNDDDNDILSYKYERSRRGRRTTTPTYRRNNEQINRVYERLDGTLNQLVDRPYKTSSSSSSLRRSNSTRKHYLGASIESQLAKLDNYTIKRSHGRNRYSYDDDDDDDDSYYYPEKYASYKTQGRYRRSRRDIHTTTVPTRERLDELYTIHANLRNKYHH